MTPQRRAGRARPVAGVEGGAEHVPGDGGYGGVGPGEGRLARSAAAVARNGSGPGLHGVRRGVGEAVAQAGVGAAQLRGSPLAGQGRRAEAVEGAQ